MDATSEESEMELFLGSLYINLFYLRKEEAAILEICLGGVKQKTFKMWKIRKNHKDL